MPPTSARARIAVGLTRIGTRLPETARTILASATAHLDLGAQLRALSSAVHPRIVADKEDVFAVARARVSGTRPLYLEFGVFEGASMRWWSEHLQQPAAHLVGFDSFEGLPEDWAPGFPAGSFKTGAPPKIDDDRVSFVTGWFDDTLPSFELPDHDQLIVNIDSDLYSSANTVLNWLLPHLRPGTLIYFDEFPRPHDEIRAFREFLTKNKVQVTPLAVSHNAFHWLFETA